MQKVPDIIDFAFPDGSESHTNVLYYRYLTDKIPFLAHSAAQTGSAISDIWFFGIMIDIYNMRVLRKAFFR